ncbi:hypothetical protein GCM10012275_09710 [Longimycelium tulufanense]|uniref:VOC domain-containing protein n=1 Tax=Longimycelium tulufanense TaxID=907463 RepID=A0A8J3FU65_9PSEU|nr:VOC family protein [Longimycelium tulufanense]GGM40825.1 hypothetical protein GCM10012275_09710 [Longimycelium tulufanense]
MVMSSAPTGTPTIYPTLLYRDVRAAIQQLTEAFGFTRAAVYEGDDGTVGYAELSYGDGTVMLSPKATGGMADDMTSGAGATVLCVLVEDADAHFQQAQRAGAEILRPPAEQHGSRSYTARDVDGNIWTFGTYAPGANRST